jgi:hypothetical protein
MRCPQGAVGEGSRWRGCRSRALPADGRRSDPDAHVRKRRPGDRAGERTDRICVSRVLFDRSEMRGAFDAQPYGRRYVARHAVAGRGQRGHVLVARNDERGHLDLGEHVGAVPMQHAQDALGHEASQPNARATGDIQLTTCRSGSRTGFCSVFDGSAFFFVSIGLVKVVLTWTSARTWRPILSG